MASSQETGNPVEDMSEQEWSQVVRMKDEVIRQQGLEIQSLKEQIQVLTKQMLVKPVVSASAAAAAPVTSLAWTRPIDSRSHVAFSTGFLDSKPKKDELILPAMPAETDLLIGLGNTHVPDLTSTLKKESVRPKTSSSRRYSDAVKQSHEYTRLDDSSDSTSSYSLESYSSSGGDSNVCHMSELKEMAKLLDKRECPKPDNYSLVW